MKTILKALLKDYTTFQLGGPCRFLVKCQTPAELANAIQFLIKDKIPYILIGGGSNLVVSDQGIDSAVIRYVSDNALIERVGDDLIVAASTILDDLALFCVDQGLQGLNFTTGIPGTVGGAVVGNAGAWGHQVGDVFKSAQIIGADGNILEVQKDYFSFSYRHSKLKETGEIVSSVRFSLKPSDSLALACERAEILKKRAEKHPNLHTHPCAGSFFRNIEPTSKAERRQAAGWFLQEAGAKDFHVGGAYIFDKHANIIVKGPQCSAQDVHDLHLKMIDAVKDRFNLQLIREVRFVGGFKSQNEREGFW